jgi:hypothetical protein
MFGIDALTKRPLAIPACKASSTSPGCNPGKPARRPLRPVRPALSPTPATRPAVARDPRARARIRTDAGTYAPTTNTHPRRTPIHHCLDAQYPARTTRRTAGPR